MVTNPNATIYYSRFINREDGSYKGANKREIDALCEFLDVPTEEQGWLGKAIVDGMKAVFDEDTGTYWMPQDMFQESLTWAMENRKKVERSIERGNFGLFTHDLGNHLRGIKIEDAEGYDGQKFDDDRLWLDPVVKYLLPEALIGAPGELNPVRREILDDVLAAYDMLDETDQQLLADHHLAGMTTREMAETRGVAQSWLVDMLTRAVSRLSANVSPNSKLDRFRRQRFLSRAGYSTGSDKPGETLGFGRHAMSNEQMQANASEMYDGDKVESSQRLDAEELSSLLDRGYDGVTREANLDETVKRYATWRYANFMAKRIAANIDNERRFAELKRKTMGAIVWE